MNVFELMRKYEYFEVGDPDDEAELELRIEELRAKGIDPEIKYSTVEPEHKELAFLVY